MTKTRNQAQKTAETQKNANINKAKTSTSIPRGKPKSGRVWKTEKTKFSSIIKTRGLKNSVAKKLAVQQDLKRIRELSRAMAAEKNNQVEARKQRRRDNLKKQEENRKKSEVVQVITNTSKLKKMKKKQLRYIEKRDTTTTKK